MLNVSKVIFTEAYVIAASSPFVFKNKNIEKHLISNFTRFTLISEKHLYNTTSSYRYVQNQK